MIIIKWIVVIKIQRSICLNGWGNNEKPQAGCSESGFKLWTCRIRIQRVATVPPRTMHSYYAGGYSTADFKWFPSFTFVLCPSSLFRYTSCSTVVCLYWIFVCFMHDIIAVVYLNQRWPELIHDLESATGSYTRALIGAAGVVNIPRYQCRIFADTDCSFVFVDVIINLLTAVCHCLQICLWLRYVLTSGVLLHGVVYNKLKVTSHFWSRLI